MNQAHPRAARDGVKYHQEPDLKLIEYKPTGYQRPVTDQDYRPLPDNEPAVKAGTGGEA